MRLAIVMSSMSYGGAQRVAALLCNHWAARGEAICLITLDSSSLDRYELGPGVCRIALEKTGDARSLSQALIMNWGRMVALRRALMRFGGDVVLSFGDQTNVLAVLATRFSGIRCVVAEVTDPGRHSIGTIWNVLRRATYPLASALVVQTRALLPWARSLMFGDRRAHVVRNPVRDMGRFLSSEKNRDCRVALSVGRLAPEKGLDILLTAFSRVAEEFPEWSLVLLGEGPERDNLVALACSLGISHRVSFPGWRAEPGDWFAKADLFLMPSRYEGFPNALLEAMACGLPSIASDCLGSREIVTPDVDGVLVPIDSVSDLTAAMRVLMQEEARRERLARSARVVSERFRLEDVVQDWDAILMPRRTVRKVCSA